MHPSIEPLEHRIAPAAVFTYTEADGDLVTVKTTAKVSNEYFESLADIVDGRLESLALVGAVFQNSSLTITVQQQGGDGTASIGNIYSNADLKNVVINGDLDGIQSGDWNLGTSGLSKLQVHHLGGDGEESLFRGGAKTIKVLGDLTGHLFAGEYEEYDQYTYLYANSTINNINVKGSIKLSESGYIPQIDARQINSVVVAGDMGGNIYATTIKSVRIGGSLDGGTAESYYNDIQGRYVSQGSITAETIKSVRIGDHILGGDYDYTGYIEAEYIGSIAVGKDIVGGAGYYSGTIDADEELTRITVGGNVEGGSGYRSGTIQGDEHVGLIRIGGDLKGGSDEYSGGIFADEGGSVEKIVIKGSIIGSDNPYAWGNGQVDVNLLGSIQVGGSIVGGAAGWSGMIDSSSLGSAQILGSLLGGSGEYSGSIHADRGISSVRVGTDLVGGTGEYSGTISTYSGIGTVKIGGNVHGDAHGSGSILSWDGPIDSILISGSLTNTGNASTGIYADGYLGRVTIGAGAAGGLYGTLSISGGYQLDMTVPSIGSVIIKGNVTNLDILAGVDPSGEVNPEATIESVSISGDFITSSIAAGASPGDDGFFGTEDDDEVVVSDLFSDHLSRIAKVVIGGTATGNAVATEGYGIFAQHIVSLKVDGAKQTLQTGGANDLVAALLSGTTNVRYAELPILAVG